MDIDALLEKLARIEALYAGAATPGERAAAAEARDRVRARVKAAAATAAAADPPVEYRFSITDPWARRVFIALVRRYDLEPFRFRGQRASTVMVRVSDRFVRTTLWPEFKEIEQTLRRFLDDVTNDVIARALHSSESDVTEVVAPGRLGVEP